MQGLGDIRVNMAVTHLLSAASLCRRVGELERANADKEFGEFWNDIFANATGTVFTTIAALEAYANELFIDHATVFPDLPVEEVEKLWKDYEKKPVLEKFESAFSLKNLPPMSRGTNPYQDVVVLVHLRNGLVHFKSEWFGAQKEHAKLSAKLAHRASLSSFFSDSEPLFPRGWASHMTMQWVVRSSLKFILKFERHANLEPRMSQFRDKFNAL